MTSKPSTPISPSVVVISGGTAANSLVSAFQGLAGSSPLTYVLPISDNGGSTSEISRVIGGPGIGDIRSRLIRLMNDTTPEQAAIKKLMSHRLSVEDENVARAEWLQIVEGTHSLWEGISSEKTELLRAFLRYVQSDISKLSRPGSRFDFRNGSIGNFFLTGARLFFGSLEASIYLLSSISSLPETTTVLPIINTNHSTHIAAKLPCPPYIIIGQNQISHPSHEVENLEDTIKSPIEDDATHLPGSLASLNGSMRNLLISKEEGNSLPGKIERIFYVNPYGNEVYPSPNPRVINALKKADVLIYSIGSLFTSIIPCLIPKGIAATIISSPLKHKIFLLNNTPDRETTGFASATDYVAAIVTACKDSLRASHTPLQAIETSTWNQFVTHVVYLREGKVHVDIAELKKRGIECVGVWAGGREGEFEAGVLERVLGGICSGRGGGLQRRATVQNWPIAKE